MKRFLVGRNPDPESSLPFLVRLPIGAGLVLKARDSWPAPPCSRMCRKWASSTSHPRGRRSPLRGRGKPPRPIADGRTSGKSPGEGAAGRRRDGWHRGCAAEAHRRSLRRSRAAARPAGRRGSAPSRPTLAGAPQHPPPHLSQCDIASPAFRPERAPPPPTGCPASPAR